MIADVFLKRTFGLQGIRDWLQQNKLGFVLLPWLAAAIGVLVAKRSLLTNVIYRPFNHIPFRAIDEIALSLRNPPVLYFWEKVSLFRADLLVYFLVVPLVFCLLTCRLSQRWRLAIAILGAFFVEVVVYFEALVYFVTGAFSSVTMIWLSVAWAVNSHSTAFFNLPAMAVFKIAANVCDRRVVRAACGGRFVQEHSLVEPCQSGGIRSRISGCGHRMDSPRSGVAVDADPGSNDHAPGILPEQLVLAAF